MTNPDDVADDRLPLAKCEKCGSTNLKDTCSFMIEIYKCLNCGELFCQDSGGVGWDI
jgi:DNA-directed RNA polymerase subunit RPC12/RpoP